MFAPFALVVQMVTASEVGAPPVLDYGDHSSETLTVKAWEALGQKQYSFVMAYTNKCIELYMEEAKKMQSGLTSPAPKETASSFWALNDVGTCLFIQGQAYEALEKNAEALEAYKTLVDYLSFAQTWDPKGWFWAPADAAKQRIRILEFDSL